MVGKKEDDSVLKEAVILQLGEYGVDFLVGLEDAVVMMGDFSAPDAHFFWCTRRFTQFKLDLTPFPNVAAHFERMQTRPSVQKLLAFEQETIEGFKRAA